MIKFPFKELEPGFYGYRRQGWEHASRVEVYISKGYHDGEKLVRFVEGYYGMKLNDLAMDAEFYPPSDDDVPMR